METSLVTGGAGFIGSHLAAALITLGHRVVVLDDLSTGRRENLDGLDVEFVEASVIDRRVLPKTLKNVDNVFHLAALVGVPESMEDPESTFEVNVVGTTRLLIAAGRAGVKRFVLSSSSAVYGDDTPVPNLETAYPGPQSPYGLSKLDGEYLLKMYAPDMGINAVSLRYFNVYGPRQDPHSPYAAVIPIFIDRATTGQDLIVYGDGEQTRDFISVIDVARANIHALDVEPGAYNVGCGSRITVNELARRVIDLTGSPSKIVHDPPRPGDIYHSMADVTLLTATGFKPFVDLDAGLKETIDHFQSQA